MPRAEHSSSKACTARSICGCERPIARGTRSASSDSLHDVLALKKRQCPRVREAWTSTSRRGSSHESQGVSARHSCDSKPNVPMHSQGTKIRFLFRPMASRISLISYKDVTNSLAWCTRSLAGVCCWMASRIADGLVTSSTPPTSSSTPPPHLAAFV